MINVFENVNEELRAQKKLLDLEKKNVRITDVFLKIQIVFNILEYTFYNFNT